MSTEVETEFTAPDVGTQLAKFSPSDAAIAEMQAAYMVLAIAGPNDSKGYQVVHKARMDVKSRRVEVDKVRKALKADALEYGRRVDAEAKRITAQLEPIEAYLESQESAYLEEKTRIRLEAEAAERAKIEAELKAKREAEEAALKLQREAEEQRLQAEREKLAAERKALEEQQAAEAERQRIERDKLAEERAKLEAEQRAIADAKLAAERAEQDRLAKIKADQDAETERKRIEVMRPDVEKINAMGAVLRGIKWPTTSSDAVLTFIDNAMRDIQAIAKRCEQFKA